MKLPFSFGTNLHFTVALVEFPTLPPATVQIRTDDFHELLVAAKKKFNVLDSVEVSMFLEGNEVELTSVEDIVDTIEEFSDIAVHLLFKNDFGVRARLSVVNAKEHPDKHNEPPAWCICEIDRRWDDAMFITSCAGAAETILPSQCELIRLQS